MKTLGEIIQIAKNPMYSVELSEYEIAERAAERDNETEGDLNQHDGYECSVCKNKGIMFDVLKDVDENGNVSFREVAKECKCVPIRKSIRRMKQSGLEGIISKCLFSNYEVTEDWQKVLKDKAEDFIKTIGTNDRWFFIGGAIGCGKTHLCTAIARELLLSGKEVFYMLWIDESNKLKAIVNDEERYGRRIDQLKNVDVLYIDDFFKILRGNNSEELKPTGADVKLAYEILNYRYQKPELITIISSERMIGEIEQIDSAIGSRIYEKARNYLLNVGRKDGRNYRMREVDTI